MFCDDTTGSADSPVSWNGFGTMIASFQSRSLAMLFLFLIPSFVAADIYRWVDDHGNTQFSDAPPRTRDYNEIIVEEPPTSSSQEREEEKQRWKRIIENQEKSRAARLKREEEKRAEQEAKKQEKAVREQRCLAARQNLQALFTPRPVYRFNLSGERVFINDQQRLAEIERVRGEIEEFCD